MLATELAWFHRTFKAVLGKSGHTHLCWRMRPAQCTLILCLVFPHCARHCSSQHHTRLAQLEEIFDCLRIPSRNESIQRACGTYYSAAWRILQVNPKWTCTRTMLALPLFPPVCPRISRKSDFGRVEGNSLHAHHMDDPKKMWMLSTENKMDEGGPHHQDNWHVWMRVPTFNPTRLLADLLAWFWGTHIPDPCARIFAPCTLKTGDTIHA